MFNDDLPKSRKILARRPRLFDRGVFNPAVLAQASAVNRATAAAVIVKTRFSLRWRGALPSREWLESRFEMLKRITLPSLQAQTLPEFDWAILTDPELERDVAGLFRDVATPGRASIVPVGSTEPTVSEEATESLRRGRDRFLVVRLDSDDALAPDALERIVAASRTLGDDEGLINLPSGVVLDWETGRAWKRRFRERYQGPFYALTHSNRDRVLFSGGDHRQAREGRRIAVVPDVSWLQTVHPGNIDNRLPGRTVGERVKTFLKRTADALSPAEICIDDLEPLNPAESADFLERFGVRR